MIFDGMKFRRMRNVVALPVRDDAGQLMPYVPAGRENYVYFGKVASERDAGAVKTRYTYQEGTPVFALPIEMTGHGLTNLAYGKDGRAYLMKDGWCYQTAPLH